MDFWRNKTALVTAAHGFTGSHLVRELVKEGAQVKAYVKPGSILNNLEDVIEHISIVQGDIVDRSSLENAMHGVDYVFNPAAIVPVVEARKFPQKTFEVNAIGAFNVAQTALLSGVKKMLHVSTCHVYGNVPENELPIIETTPVRPETWDLYAASKYAAEIILRPLVNEGFPIVFTRAFAKYGPGQGPQFLIPRVITQMLEPDKTITLGNPKPTRDYTYITDTVQGYLLALEKGKAGEIYQFCLGQELSIGEVVEKIKQAIGTSVTVTWNIQARPNDILRQFGDATKARKELGWEPKVTLQDGLKMTVDWWKKQRQHGMLLN